MEERDTEESLYFQLEQMERIFKRLDPHLFLSWVNSGHTVPGQDPTLLFNKSFCDGGEQRSQANRLWWLLDC